MSRAVRRTTTHTQAPALRRRGHRFLRCGFRQQELPQDDELLPQDDELLQEDELLPEQAEEPPHEEPDDEPSQASPAAYQDEELDEVPAAPAADGTPVPVLVGHAPCHRPAPQPYPDACRPRSSQARRQARRTSQAHSAAIPSTAAATTTKAVTITSPFHRAMRTGCTDHAPRPGDFNLPLSKPRGSP